MARGLQRDRVPCEKSHAPNKIALVYHIAIPGNGGQYHLTAQCLPNLLWGQLNKTLHVTVL